MNSFNISSQLFRYGVQIFFGFTYSWKDSLNDYFWEKLSQMKYCVIYLFIWCRWMLYPILLSTFIGQLQERCFILMGTLQSYLPVSFLLNIWRSFCLVYIEFLPSSLALMTLWLLYHFSIELSWLLHVGCIRVYTRFLYWIFILFFMQICWSDFECKMGSKRTRAWAQWVSFLNIEL